MNGKTITASQARRGFGRLLDEVTSSSAIFFVKHRGKQAAVIISPQHYADLREILAELGDADFRQALGDSKKEIESGKTVSEKELFNLLRGKMTEKNQ